VTNEQVGAPQVTPAAQPDTQADTSRRPAGGHRKEGGEGARRKEAKEAKEAERQREHGKRNKGGSAPPAPEGGAAAGETPLTAPALADTPATLAPIATASSVSVAAQATPSAQVTVPAVAGAHAQAGASNRARVPRRGSRSGGRETAQRAASAAADAASPVVAVAGLGRLARGRRQGSVRAGARHGGATTARPTPLVSTITRIVDVVPTPIRALIAGLLGLALLLAMRSRLIARRAHGLERQRVQLLEDVGLLQAALLPTPPDRLGPVGTSVAYKPAAGPGAGGDFYDVFALEDGQLAVIVGDVSGHGRQALPHTALLRFTLRAYLEAGLSPRDAVQTAGEVLEHQLAGQFATVVVATYNPRERLLVYSCAGHPAPLVLSSNTSAGSVAHVSVCSSPPIGVGMRTGIRQTSVSIPGRAQVCFHTDGVTEARCGSELFGTQRLLDTLAGLGSDATAAALLDSVVAQADARPDDMAACLLRIEGNDGQASVVLDELELYGDAAAGERSKRFLLACGLERAEAAQALSSARAAAGRTGTVVLHCRRSDGPPQITLRRDRLAYLHVRRAALEIAR
jgi:Stage II sporulation protein E (SpoIIE)